MDFLILDFAQALILVFGIIVVFYAIKASRRTKSRSMLLLGAGFAFVTAGAVIAGILFNLVAPQDLETAETVQAVGQALGFFIIVYSFARTKD